MERNLARIFYTIKENFWSQDGPEGGTWVGTTHQGAPPLLARPGGLYPPGGPSDDPHDTIKSHISKKNQGERIIAIHETESRQSLFFLGRADLESVRGSGEGIFVLRHHQPISIANSMMLPTGSE